MNYTVIFDGEKIHSDIKIHSDGGLEKKYSWGYKKPHFLNRLLNQ